MIEKPITNKEACEIYKSRMLELERFNKVSVDDLIKIRNSKTRASVKLAIDTYHLNKLLYEKFHVTYH